MPGFVRPDRLRRRIEAGDDATFLVVDIRPEAQYRLDHIPGAVNIPLDEIASQTPRFGAQIDVVFCCRNGVRSKVAAILAVDDGLDPERAFTLEGGISAYAGEILLELPRLALFEGLTDPGDVAAVAVNFERGAWRFYTAASKLGLATRTIRFLEKMARLEADHARALFDRLAPEVRGNLSFETYFNTCPGDILEGGKAFDQVVLSNTPVDDDLLDLALEIETGAYDLYKQCSFLHKSAGEVSFFLMMAHDEKRHMAMIADFLSGNKS